MKRLFIVASMAIMAVGCQKTTVENEVLTPIGFSTEVAKQTRAIVTDGTYFKNQPFKVYAYGKQSETVTTVMNGVDIVYYEATTGENPTLAKWAAAENAKYYWPNDASTTMNFYAYSPNTIAATHSGNEGKFSVASYVNNMYTDFMIATPVTGAKYSDQNGAVDGTPSSVPVKFNHQLTQIVFDVTANIPGVKVTLQSIELLHVGTTAAYTNEVWGEVSAPNTSGYVVFPASTTAGAPANETAAVLETGEGKTTNVVTTPVVMIPQTLVATVKEGDSVTTQGQQFKVVYDIEGTGVAKETVTKTFDLKANTLTKWDVNKKVTYKLTVGLTEITFDPTVEGWSDVDAGNVNIN